MNFPSVAGVALVVILVLAVVRFVPLRSKRAEERSSRQSDDRFSTTLHVLSDERASQADKIDGKSQKRQQKGKVAMATQSKKLGADAIAATRLARNAAIRRRRRMVIVLLVLTVATVVAGTIAHFSLLFGLIPFALLVLVLALGVRVTKKNREWELKIAQQVQQQQKQQQQSRRESDLETVRQSVRATFEDAGDALDAPTYVIPVAKVVEREKAVQEPIAHEPAAVTPETPLSSSASPAPAAEQDLISFSLGGSPSHVGVDDVQSLEIRSQKQVARAVPVPPAAPAPTPVSASVSAPALTEDSLGVAIDEVLLRRRR